MKTIKNIIVMFLVAICALFCACKENEQPLSKNQPYVFEKSVCTVYDGVDMQKLSSFVPMMLPKGQKRPETVEEFENMVLENIDEYSVCVFEDGERIEIYFRCAVESVEITDTLCKLVGKESAELPYEQNGNAYTVTAGETELTFTYENNRLSYTIIAPELFEVTHYFKLA